MFVTIHVRAIMMEKFIHYVTSDNLINVMSRLLPELKNLKIKYNKKVID